MNESFQLLVKEQPAILVGVIILSATIVVICLVNGVCSVINRVIRGANIRKHGWPPAHVDADGDARDDDDDDCQG